MALYTYRISLLGSMVDTSVAPSPLLLAVFPQWNGEPTSGSDNAILVTFLTPQTPTDLGPLVKVETLSN